MQIAIAFIVLALCGGFLYWMKRTENKKAFHRSEEEQEEREKAARQTAQEFVNVKDLGQNCLYTLDNMIFAYIKIEGLCLELHSKAEQRSLCKRLSSALSQVKRPYKYIAVSRPVDISKSIQMYDELIRSADVNRKKLLRIEQRELADMVMSGETLERQHYVAVWDTTGRADERSITAAAQDLAKKFSENGVRAEMLDKKGIVRLCNLVNIPSYVHIESADISDAITVLSENG